MFDVLQFRVPAGSGSTFKNCKWSESPTLNLGVSLCKEKKKIGIVVAVNISYLPRHRIQDVYVML